MCPSFKVRICEVAGIEPERIHCADKNSCLEESGRNAHPVYRGRRQHTGEQFLVDI